MKLPIYSRILIIIGLSLIIASLIATTYGAKTSTNYHGLVSLGSARGVAVYAMTLGGEGVLRVEVHNAETVFYISNISGDIGTLMGSLRVFNISAFNAKTIHDVRAGLIYGYAELKTSKFLLKALPGIAKMLHFSIKEVSLINGSARISERLLPGEGLLVVIIPRSGSADFSLDYHIVGYKRIGVYESIVLSFIVIMAGLVLAFPKKRISFA